MRTATMLREAAAPADHPEAVRPASVDRHARDKPKPHVCFVAPHAWPVFSGDPHIQVVGGAEVQQAILARLFAASGYRVSMICLDFGQPPRVEIDGVEVLRLYRMKAGIPVLRFVHPRLTTMWRRLHDANADIYYCRSASMWVGVVAAFCRRNGRRLVYAGASDKDFVPDVGGQIRFARDRWLYRRGLAAADAIVAQNEVQRADCHAHYGREAVVVPSCYQLPATSSAEPRDRVLWVGTLHDGKRPEMLLELARRLPKRRFVMIGGPSDASPGLFERMRAQAAALPNVEFQGFLPLAQAEPWFDRARVLVNTSVYEGMPNVFLQAWARGVPTVATVDVGVPAHRVATTLEALEKEVEGAFADQVRGEACRKYFERTHGSAEVLERYGRIFDSIRVNTASKTISLNRLKRRALSLGSVKAFDQAMQFVLPIVLARCLDTATFGEYRLLWLVVATAMLCTLNMGGSLYYFLPRSAARDKKVYVHNTVVYFLGAGTLFALAISPLNPFLPATMAPLASYGPLVPAFVALWFAATLLDYLPTIEERIRWQARASMGMAALRVVLVGSAAWFSGELEVILWVLLAAVVVKLGLLLLYIYRHHGLGRPWLRPAAFGEQLRYSIPFGVSTGLFSLRGQIDQWVAASLFALSSFAAFTIAALVGQVVHIFRHSVMEAFLPSMSRLEAAGDVRGMMEMNARGNAMIGRMLYPLLALAFAFAEDLITIVYTAAYVEAAPVMRVYVVGMMAMVIEVGSVILLLRQGAFAVRVNAFVLCISAAVSWVAAHHIGLAGAAAGSVLGIYLDRSLMLTRVARHTGIGLRRLQHWRALGWAMGSAALAAALAWVFTHHMLPGAAPMVRVAAGSTVLALAYVAMNYRSLR